MCMLLVGMEYANDIHINSPAVFILLCTTRTSHTLRTVAHKRVIDGHGDGLALQLQPISSVKISCCGHISSLCLFPNAFFNGCVCVYVLKW